MVLESQSKFISAGKKDYQTKLTDFNSWIRGIISTKRKSIQEIKNFF